MTALVPLTEVRRRLDVTSGQVSDDILNWCIDTAEELIAPYEIVGNYALKTEATIQLAVKIYDSGQRGTISVDPAGEWVAPAPSATAGLVKAVWGILGPATATGGGGFA